MMRSMKAPERPALLSIRKVRQHIIKTLQNLLRLSVRDGLPVLLTVAVIRFHGLKNKKERHITMEEGW